MGLKSPFKVAIIISFKLNEVLENRRKIKNMQNVNLYLSTYS